MKKRAPISEETRAKMSQAAKLRLKTHPHTNVSGWNRGIKGTHFSPETEFKKGVTPKNSMVFIPGETQFKGDLLEYKKIHHKISILFGKPKKCEDCGGVFTGKKIHWANATGIYNEDRKNWKRLCAKCHYKFDQHDKRKVRAV